MRNFSIDLNFEDFNELNHIKKVQVKVGRRKRIAYLHICNRLIQGLALGYDEEPLYDHSSFTLHCVFQNESYLVGYIWFPDTEVTCVLNYRTLSLSTKPLVTMPKMRIIDSYQHFNLLGDLRRGLVQYVAVSEVKRNDWQ